MKELENHPLLNRPYSYMYEYRLHSNAFYFKLCDPTDENIEAQGLVPGLYFPLDYWKFLMNSREIYGEKGGRRFEKGEVRYINNSLFILLLQEGWIGSISDDITTFHALIQDSIDSGNSVIIAKKEPIIHTTTKNSYRRSYEKYGSDDLYR